MKTVIIGANHAGIAAANTLLDNYPEQKVVMIDRNTNLSYLGCGTALWVGRQIDSYEKLFYTNKEAFEAKGADIRMETSVRKIDFDKKIVYCESADGTTSEETYDKLVLATGSLPIAPALPGNDLEGISFLKLFQDGQEVDRQISDDSVKNVAVIGAGYIGVEIAEAAKRCVCLMWLRLHWQAIMIRSLPKRWTGICRSMESKPITKSARLPTRGPAVWKRS